MNLHSDKSESNIIFEGKEFSYGLVVVRNLHQMMRHTTYTMRMQRTWDLK